MASMLPVAIFLNSLRQSPWISVVAVRRALSSRSERGMIALVVGRIFPSRPVVRSNWLISDLFSIIAVNDFALRPIRIDDDWHQDAVDGDGIPKCRELFVGQSRQLEDRLVNGLPGRLPSSGLRHEFPPGVGDILAERRGIGNLIKINEIGGYLGVTLPKPVFGQFAPNSME
jgi:hypothetical protein